MIEIDERIYIRRTNFGEMCRIKSRFCCNNFYVSFFCSKWCRASAKMPMYSFEYWRPPYNGISCWKYITIFWSYKMALTYSDWNFLFSCHAFIYRMVKIDSCRSCISVKLPKSMDPNVRHLFCATNFMNGMKYIFHLSISKELHIFFEIDSFLLFVILFLQFFPIFLWNWLKRAPNTHNFQLSTE